MHTDVLIIIDQDKARHNHVLDQKSLSLGRAQSNDIVLDDNAISRHHLELQRHHDEWRIVDLNSTNGVFLEDTRLHPKQDMSWNRDKILRIGPYHLTWQRHDSSPHTPQYNDHVAESADYLDPLITNQLDEQPYDAAPPVREVIRAVLSPDLFDIAPGEQTVFNIEVMNMGVTAEDFQIWIEDLPNAWYELSQTSVRLMPRERRTIPCTVSLPHEPIRIGFYDYQVRVESDSADYATALTMGQLNVQEFYQFNMDVSHDIRNNGTVYNITLLNEGNVQDSYHLQDIADSQGITLTTRSNQVDLLPQTQDTIHVMIEPQKRHLIGGKRTIPFELEIAASSGETQKFEDEVTVRPYVSFIFLCWLALALALVGAIIWGLSSLNSQFESSAVTQQIMAAQQIIETVFL